MANIWDATLEPDNNVKQNTFDWTHVNNLTTQIGRITPIQCELVPAKTSFRAKPIPALQLMPMVFPIQTRMRASIAYFRYPLRALWKDYKDFIGNFRTGLEEPYHDFNSQTIIDKMLKTGQLMDYLGIPTTLVGNFGNTITSTWDWYTGDKTSQCNTTLMPGRLTLSAYENLLFTKTADELAGSDPAPSVSSFRYVDTLRPSLTKAVDKVSFPLSFDSDNVRTAFYNGCRFVAYDASGKPLMVINPSTRDLLLSSNQATLVLTSDVVSRMAKLRLYFPSIQASNFSSPLGSNGLFLGTLGSVSYMEVNPNIAELSISNSPYYNSNSANKDKQIKLSAYAARAYEGIYNSIYRDNRNNPYYIDGVVQYNQWIPTYEGGADTYPYELRYANWEKDFLTTSVQSPQQGNAPLVGITTYDQVTRVYDEQGNPTLTQQTKVAMVDEDGKRYSLEFESDKDELKGVKYVELDNGTTVRSARTLFDLVTSGISITDLRNVNAYQKFLELNMRKGYSYKEIIEGRFDIKVRYADLLLPEFFGGFSRDINMNAISQTVDQTAEGEGAYKDVLGSQAGIGYFRGGSDANIECFCDEESIIMGLLVITPLPVYTQLLPKHFLYRGLLDHFNPEFNNISFQPITYKEVCPIQAYNADPNSLTETFGYQRPWYEYCQRYDQAHGLFRTDLSNFLMHRVFDKKPELSQGFLTIDPDQVTDVFSVTDVTDKVYGQILIDCTVKLPVARVAIPRLD